MAGITKISFRSQLKGEISDFLEKSGMASVETIQAMTDLIVDLSHYEEEGTPLYPKILLCNSLQGTLAFLQGSTPIQVGNNPTIILAMKQALKKCAPLARQGWSIYLEQDAGEYRYGVFRESEFPTALDIRETLASLPKESVNAVLACQIAEKAVELVGTAKRHLHIHLSAVSAEEPPANASLDTLIQATISDVPESTREPMRSYLSSTVGSALLHGHGALIAVLQAGQPIPAVFADDGVLLPEPIELTSIVQIFLTTQNSESTLALISYGALLEGMLGCDGITILRSDGAIIGYNFFVKDDNVKNKPASELIGGARRRAFAVLCRVVEEGEANCVFIRSSNGSSEHRVKTGVQL